MSSGARHLAAWGTGVLAIALLGVLVFDLGSLPAGLLAGAGAAALLVAAAAAVAERRRPRAALAVRPEVPPGQSLPATTAALGVVVVLVGVGAVGQTFTWPGLLLVALGVVGAIRERRDARRRERAAERGRRA